MKVISIVPSGSHPGCYNRWGVFDLNGNVSEWVGSINHRPDGSIAVLRGGTAWPGEDYGQDCFTRHAHPIFDAHWPDDGFRCCTEPRPPGADSAPSPSE